MKNILLINGVNLSRGILHNLIDSDSEMRVVGEACQVSEAIEKIRKGKVDVVVIDNSLPQENGLETFCDIKQASPNIPVLVVSGSDHENDALPFIRLGCQGYLSKHSCTEQVLQAIKAIAAGQQYMIASLKELAVHSLYAGKALYEDLSAREAQVFFKLIKGQSVGSVARELSITSSSVSIFRSKILRKMHLKCNAELVYYALRNHLIT
ncbi:MAG TPA: response regulator transcription factor [Methylophilaceae bacterium]|jgi:DNA-binding NarL/FixJ family response regulator